MIGARVAQKFDIKPYIGVGSLKFKMRPDEVVGILGKPDDVDEENGEELREYRVDNGLQTVYSSNVEELVEIGFSSNIIGLSYNGIELFRRSSADVLDFLIAEDKSPYALLGYIVLLSLGVTLTGFHDADEDQKAVTVFTKGRWNSMKDKLTPF